MSWIDFYKEREALSYSGEMFKNTAIRYLQLYGYRLKISSSKESSFPDAIMWKKSQPDIWLEAKATKVSIFEKRFQQQLIKYFYEWLKYPKIQRFELWIFAHQVVSPDKTKKILTRNAIKNETLNWFLQRNEEGLEDKIKQRVSTAKNDEIIEFFHNITFVIGKGYVIEDVIRERTKNLKKYNPKNSLLLRELKLRHLPLKKKTKISLNFMEISFPKTFWEVESKYKTVKSIYEKSIKILDGRTVVFSLQRINENTSVIRSFDDNIALMKNCIKGNVVKKHFSTLNHQNKVWLLNTHLRRLLWCKGLKRNDCDFFFSYDQSKTNSIDKHSKILIKGPKNNNKIVTRPLFSGNNLNFVEHHAIRIKIGLLDGCYGIFLWPRFVFTSDGNELLDGSIAKKIYLKYRNPEYNRNQNKRSELNFWSYFIRNDYFVRKKEKWFDSFKFGPLKTLEVDWTSEAYSLNRRLTEFFGGQ